MRIFVLFAVVAAIAFGAWAIVGQAPGTATAANAAQTGVYSGPGETNLDLDSADNTLYLDVAAGRVVIRMRPDLAPLHVARIKDLVRQGHYDGLTFHRVIEDFMAQGGDPKGDGSGGTGVKIPGEFTTKHHFDPGIVGMARSRDINSADSQFFIMLGKGRWLDGKYTIWGEVLDGMAFVHAIKKGNKNMNGKIEGEPDKIIRMQIKADAEQ